MASPILSVKPLILKDFLPYRSKGLVLELDAPYFKCWEFWQSWQVHFADVTNVTHGRDDAPFTSRLEILSHPPQPILVRG